MAAAFGWKARVPVGFLCRECSAIINHCILEISDHAPCMDDSLHEGCLEHQQANVAIREFNLAFIEERFTFLGRKIWSDGFIVPCCYLIVIGRNYFKKCACSINLANEFSPRIVDCAGPGVSVFVFFVIFNLQFKGSGLLEKLTTKLLLVLVDIGRLVSKHSEPFLTSLDRLIRGHEPRRFVLQPLRDGRIGANCGSGRLSSHLIELTKDWSTGPDCRADGQQASQKRLPTVHAPEKRIPTNDPRSCGNNSRNRTSRKPQRYLSTLHGRFPPSRSDYPHVGEWH